MPWATYVASLLALAKGVVSMKLVRSSGALPASTGDVLRKDQECQPPAAYRQQLKNMVDLQYYTEISIGGQSIYGIIDTGSFELVVFSRHCTTCGKAGVYDSQAASTSKAGNQTKVHAYGSGSCTSQDLLDEVQLGCYTSRQQAIWLAMECQMPLLAQAAFNAIVGVGPPGQPEFTARGLLRQLEEAEERSLHVNGTVTQEITQAKRQVEAELEDALQKRSLLESLGMKTFSTCLGRKPGSPAWMIWNDITREGMPGVQKIPVVGNITWGVKVAGMDVEFAPSDSTDVEEITTISVGCAEGCGAIVDTGTSLLGVPTETFKAIADALEKYVLASDCSDLSVFPDLIITVGGHKLRLPPASYIGIMDGMPTDQVGKYLHMNRDRSSEAQCQLLLMDLGQELTQFGPMVILGMPFFREYYTTFDLGAGRESRSIFVSRASESCHPDVAGGMQYLRNRAAFMPRRVDASQVRIPDWLGRRTGMVV